MPLKLQLTGKRPGYGQLRIDNLAAAGELQFSFQRGSDQHFLGAGQQWLATAHWHAVGGVEADGGGCGCLLGPDIIDGLLPSSNDAILVSVQGEGISGKGRMRIASSLLGSGAEGNSREQEPIPIPSPPPTTTPEPVPTPTPEPEPIASPMPSPPAAGNRWRWMLLAAVVLLTALFAAWYFDLLKLPGLPGGSAGIASDSVPADEVSSDNGGAGEDKSIVEPEPALQGRLRAQAYLAGEPRPAPKAMFDQAADWEHEGDCEAAMIVYQVAAQSDAEVAARYAYLYDPDTFKASGCIKNADPETAAYWYEAPAGAGDVNAQRQLGKILVGSNDSGALRDQGEAWLGRAAQAGDSEASALIEKLGIGGD